MGNSLPVVVVAVVLVVVSSSVWILVVVLVEVVVADFLLIGRVQDEQCSKYDVAR